MRLSRFSENQIVSILKEAKNGRRVKEFFEDTALARSDSISGSRSMGGHEVSDLKRSKEPDAETDRLEKIYANMALEFQAMRDLPVKL